MTIQFGNVSDLDTRPVAKPVSGASFAGFYRVYAKRAFDVFLVLLSAPFTLPLVLAVAAFAALDGSSPFYRQARIGRGGRIFSLLKIRTMVPDADTLLEAHLQSDPKAREEWDRTQKLKRDPRITRFGAFLRKTSLDELPQLLNVLRGDMSLIGPRPMMVEQKELYPGTAYYALRPGITGLWQVSKRNESSFADRAKFDNVYHNGLSFRRDLGILVRTVHVVLRGTGC
jgi:lipopolysaccharide/colanic/teichoic acid biosynthesis glycosyltransferase